MKTFTILTMLALAGFQTRSAQALGLGYQIGQETALTSERRIVAGSSSSSDLAYQSLSVNFTTQRFTLMDLNKVMSTGLSANDGYDVQKFYWGQAEVGKAEKDTRWIDSSAALSFIMGSSTNADQVLVAGGPTEKPASTNSFWGVDFDMGLGEYQFLKAPLEVSFSYDVQFRSYTFASVFDGVKTKAGDTGGMTVNGYASIGAELGVFPGIVAWGRFGYDPMMSAVAALYPDLISPGYQMDAGAEWQPLRFLSVFATYSQQTTGFFGISRPTTINDTSFGARVFFF